MRARVFKHNRRGMGMIWMVTSMVALCGLISYGVDFGRVQVAKTTLRQAADAAARYGAMGISDGTYSAKAISAAAANTCDGQAVTLLGADVSIGNWDATLSPQFSTSRTPTNAIQVTAQRTAARSNPIPLYFARLIGFSNCNVTATSIAQVSNVVVTTPVLGQDDPYLSGEPAGTTASWGGSSPVQHDTAPAQSPANPAVTVGNGSVFTFSSSGTSTYDPPVAQTGADGFSGTILSHTGGPEHGMSDITAPASALIGVFLDDNLPDGTAPSALNFSTSGSRDFTTLSPQLKQVFFIGNGTNSTGTLQKFIAPPGATRLFLATMDGYGWVDNLGTLTVNVTKQQISIVK